MAILLPGEDPRELMEIILRFYKFRDWKVVEGYDDDGRKDQFLVLPMLRNGILMTPDHPKPVLRIRLCVANARDRERYGFVRSLKPMIPVSVHDTLVAQGLLDEEDSYWSELIGGMRPLLWASENNNNRGSAYDKFFGLKLHTSKEQKT